MPKYITKPRIKEAVRWTGDNVTEINAFVKAVDGDCRALFSHNGAVVHLSIRTLEGVMHAQYGDYIVKGIRGEFYPVKPDVFKESYDLLPEEA